MDCRARTKFFRRHNEKHAERNRALPTPTPASERITAINDWFTELSGDEAICWGYNTVPSGIEQVLWENTDDDIETKIKLKLGLVKASSVESVQGLLFAIAAAFGGIKNTRPVQSGREAEAVFNRIVGGAIEGPAELKDKAFNGLDGLFEKMENLTK